MAEEEKIVKWRLRFSGEEDTPMLRATHEYLKDFHLYGAAKCTLVSYEEYMKLVAEEKIEKPRDTWSVREREVGVISLTGFDSYRVTWEQISSARRDFEAGWNACKKHMRAAVYTPPPKRVRSKEKKAALRDSKDGGCKNG